MDRTNANGWIHGWMDCEGIVWSGGTGLWGWWDVYVDKVGSCNVI